MNSPIIIGGVGGSGTRLLNQMLIHLGVYVGSDLNEQYDNLSFTLLFKRQETLSISDNEFNKLLNIYEKTFNINKEKLTKEEEGIIFKLASKEIKRLHPCSWLKERAINIMKIVNEGKQVEEGMNEMNRLRLKDPPFKNVWGWKEPNTHMILPRLYKKYPNMKYIHLIRNGLDMAFSKNQNQLKLWGSLFLERKDYNGIVTPYASLKYWVIVHKRIFKIAQKMGNNFLLIKFDELCKYPDLWLSKLCDFLNIDYKYINDLKQFIDPPSDSIGKFRNHDLKQFDPDDVAYVASLGFDTK